MALAQSRSKMLQGRWDSKRVMFPHAHTGHVDSSQSSSFPTGLGMSLCRKSRLCSCLYRQANNHYRSASVLLGSCRTQLGDAEPQYLVTVSVLIYTHQCMINKLNPTVFLIWYNPADPQVFSRACKDTALWESHGITTVSSWASKLLQAHWNTQ